MRKFSVILSLSVLCVSSLCFSAAPTASHYEIAHKFAVAGDGGWDYLTADDASGRLFVSHGTMVQVVDEKSGKLLGTIADTKGVHGIALAPDLNKGFTSNGQDSSVTVFNLKTLEVTAKVRVTGANPDAIVYDQTSGLVLTFNGRSANATVIDAKTNAIEATINLDGKPEFPAANGRGIIFVNVEDKNMIAAINTKTLSIDHRWSTAPGEEPSGLAIDNDHHRLFSVCHNKLMVILDSDSGKVVATVPIGERVDGAAYDPATRRAYSSNGDGTLTVVQEGTDGKFAVLETVPTQKGARTIAVDTRTHHVFLPVAEYGQAPASPAGGQKGRPPILPNTFTIIDVEPAN